MRKTTKPGKILVSSSRAAANVRRSKGGGGWGNRYIYTASLSLFVFVSYLVFTTVSL